ncbi:serine/threonine-protein kinase [Myxococcus stipitatus]|uniref:serine/threonine-protein kinase n=1 Tax=Myxococcus stipitatus TaxID=83455 RepID=UPI0031455CA4
MTTTQECPNCGTQHDTRVYVSGQKLTCRCGIRFEVRRQDVGGARPGMQNASSISRDTGSNTTFAPHRARDEHTRDTVVPGLREDERISSAPYANGGALRDATQPPPSRDSREAVQESGPGNSKVGQGSGMRSSGGSRSGVAPGNTSAGVPGDEGGAVSEPSSTEAGHTELAVGSSPTFIPRSASGVVVPPSGVSLPGGAVGGESSSHGMSAGSALGSEGVSPRADALPGVPMPEGDSREVPGDVEGPSGVALPSSAPGLDEPMGATLVRSAAPTGRGRADSDMDIHAVETFVAAARVSLPGFELQEMLGRGGMGEVWLARQTSLGRTVAVKLLPPKLAKDPEFVARFEKEATALAALNHPNIVQIIDRGVAGEHYYFVMEFVEGRSLREAISASALSPQQGLKLLLQVARAIECAHDKDIIHRDLKPENILLDGRGNVKVADFGLAGIRQSESRLQLTATAVAMGTLNYMAPEQRRDAKNVDGRADLFSLGVVLYEVLTGELPLGRFKLPSQRVPGLDPRVDLVVERLLETDPEARYAKAGDLCAALEVMISTSSVPGGLAAGLITDHPPRTRRRSTSQLARRFRTGWRGMRAGLTVVGAAAVIGLVAKLVPVSVHVGKDDNVVIGTEGVKVRTGTKAWPPNTYHEVFATANLVESKTPEGESRFEVSFDDKGTEELNLHSGDWKLQDGQLRAWQGGQDAGGRRLVPRAYVAHRYFAADNFDAQVVMDVKPLGNEYPEEPDAQHYGELSFRIKDLQVSAFAIPEVGMRLAWRYFTEDGQEVVGNSAQDTDGLVEDEMPLPTTGPYLVRLKLSPMKGGVVLAEGFLGRQRFARKLLPGLAHRVGKVAVGCRNLACTFDDLKVRGQLEARPPRKVASGQEQ